LLVGVVVMVTVAVFVLFGGLVDDRFISSIPRLGQRSDGVE
jgi:hypothetical protein